ncbi:hypothetical protein [Nannocystis sp. SCPEA4]|uniref:hypothetical protein n=1 Tax=Nannocystis sp. SCPEA4 TaxID=2996787 RepID=UPI00226EDC92|nr:hypothetical protein [Nannocystis sp. SCPEA4]MCY1056413.1 hypothetical protein [Nannocystis sp. SCPEA4]
MKRRHLFTFALVLPALAGCPDNSSTSDTDAATEGTGDNTAGTEPTTGTPENCDGITVSPVDESACMPEASDYMPRSNNSADDSWPACVSDMGPYTLVAGTPGAQARIVAYENIADLLWRKSSPTPEDFTAARDEYVIAEGLESRVSRREDLHVDPIPMSDWDPQVDSDKQCTVASNVTKYPERCVGPASIQPILDEAFAAGQAGEGDPDIHAARIHGALDWFLYLSIYKEANTCATETAEDCDATWAYYTGGQSIDAGIGLSAEVKAQSPGTHERIHDGIMAVRCWRELTKDVDTYPLLDALTPEQVDLFEQGWEQLDQALHRGLAVVVRGNMKAYIDAACAGEARAAIWADIIASAPGLQGEAARRDSANAKVLSDLWAMDAPTAADVAAGVVALDAIFPCP